MKNPTSLPQAGAQRSDINRWRSNSLSPHGPWISYFVRITRTYFLTPAKVNVQCSLSFSSNTQT
jgi:hypothetical protein